MRKWIRSHPWRLEIVPAVAFFTAVGYTVHYHLSGAEAILRRATYPGEQPIQYEATIVFQICLLVFFWMIAATSNHQWVVMERRKMYNWMAPVFQFTILLYAGIAMFLARTGLPRITPDSASTDLNAIPVLALTGTAVTAILEWTRRFVPRDVAPEPDPPDDESVRTQSGICYLETGIEWGWLVMGGGALVFGILSVFYCQTALISVCNIAAGIYLCSLSRRQVEINSRGILMRSGLIRRRIEPAEVASCRATWDENGQRPRSMSRREWHQFSWNTGRCLEITTKQGHIYRFGMQRPKYVCGLIESIIGKDE